MNEATVQDDGVNERHGDEAFIGATKYHCVSCFKALGGFVREVMWDGIDGQRGRTRAWIACSWDAPICVCHLRPIGSSQTGRMRHGHGQYFMGAGFLYMLAYSVNRINEKPYMAFERSCDATNDVHLWSENGAQSKNSRKPPRAT